MIIRRLTVDSTNSEARRLIAELCDLSAVTAGEQTSGRGQGGHVWHSAPGMNLTASVVLKGRDLRASDEGRVSQAAACGVCGFLRGAGIEPRIKLPNDIWVGDCKICGLLIEHSVMQGRVEWSIVGVGLNLNETSFPEDIPNPVSVKTLTGLDTDPEHALSIILKEIGRRLDLPDDILQKEFEDLCDAYRRSVVAHQSISL